MANPVIQIEGLSQFRSALRQCQEANVRVATAAVKRAGAPILARAQELAPFATGALRGSGKVLSHGTTGLVRFAQPYAALAEFSKKPGWMSWGSPPRYGYKALEEKADEAVRIIAEGMEDIVTLLGWAT